MVNSSDVKSILQLTDLVKGQYTFHLTVTDDKGLTGTDEVSVFVKESEFTVHLFFTHQNFFKKKIFCQ